MEIERRNPPELSPPTGEYSLVSVAPAGVRMAYVAGQTGRRPNGTIPDSVEAQTAAAFEAIAAVLADLGAAPSDLVHLRTLLVGRSQQSGFARARREVFAIWFPDSKPPSNTLAFVSGLADDRAVVEIEAVIALGAD